MKAAPMRPTGLYSNLRKDFIRAPVLRLTQGSAQRQPITLRLYVKEIHLLVLKLAWGTVYLRYIFKTCWKICLWDRNRWVPSCCFPAAARLSTTISWKKGFMGFRYPEFCSYHPAVPLLIKGHPLIAWLWWQQNLCSRIPWDCNNQKVLGSYHHRGTVQKQKHTASPSVKEVFLLVPEFQLEG